MRFPGPRWLAPLAVLGLGLALRIAEPDTLQELQLRVFDTFQKLEPRPYTDVPVRIVDIDDATLEKFGQWPWPRTRVAELVEDLFGYGAAVVVFDAVFAEPDRTSPRRMLDNLEGVALSPDLERALESLPDHASELARVVSDTRVVTGFGFTHESGGRRPRSAVGFTYGGDPFTHLLERSGSVVNLPELEEAAAGNGSFSVDPDLDGTHRRVPLVFSYGGELFPSLAAEAVRVATQGTAYAIKTVGSSGEKSYGEDTGITQVRIGREFVVPTNPSGEIWVWFTERRPERFIPAWQVLEGVADRSRLEGHIVLIGTTAAGLKDIRATPLDPVAPGVAVHANIIEQILLGEYLERPDWATGAEVTYLFALGLLLVVLIPRLGAIGTALLGAGAVFAAFALSWWAYVSWRWLFDPLYPALAALGVYLVGSAQNYLASEAQRRQVRGAFGRYLSPTLVDELAANPEKLRLGGEMREMTFLFSDVRGFTTLSEQLDPHALTRLINAFLTPMTDVILERRGTIDKYMGDCVMAFWNAPLDDPEHPRHGCEAALAMAAALRELNAKLVSDPSAFGRPIPPLEIGIGLNTGMCVVGNMGSDQRFDYSVISDEVNLASRLEGQSKTYHVSIVLGENTQTKVPDLATLELDAIRVKGKTKPVRIFTLLGLETLAATREFAALRAAHDAMLEAYRARRFETVPGACEELRALAAKAGQERALEGLHALYEERAREFLASPPPADWDGVYVATTK